MFERHPNPPGEHAVHQSHFGVTKRYIACHLGRAAGLALPVDATIQDSFRTCQEGQSVKPGLRQEVRAPRLRL